jgi:KipI family sensor histidine kinase inhibitor
VSSSVRVLQYGSTGVLVDLGLGDVPHRVVATRRAQRVLENEFSDCDVVAGVGTVAIFRAAGPIPHERIVAALERTEAVHLPSREHHLEVVYDGPDLDPVAELLKLSPAELVSAHTSLAHSVELLGFLPGFAYLGTLPERLRVARRSSPRPRVAAGTVAIAGKYTGIYPFSSPGGWNLLGRSLGLPLFDPSRDEPFLFQLGDRVRFVAVPPADAPPVKRTLDLKFSLRAETRPYLRIESAPPLTTLQDVGRIRSLARGLPASGPLDPDSFAETQAAVGNPGSSAAIETWGGMLRFQCFGSPWLVVSGRQSYRPRDGEMVVVDARWAPKYIAVAGGFAADLVLGSRSTHLTAGLGGASGRALGRGDRVACLAASELTSDTRTAELSDSTDGPMSDAPSWLRVAEGPHFDLFKSEVRSAFFDSHYQVSASRDRTGTRLDGPALPPHGLELSAPIPLTRGAIQVPPNGFPIVFGPDHPVTGGYPIIAVLHPESFGALARAPVGSAVRFVLKA